MNDKITPPLFPGYENIADFNEKQRASTEAFVNYLRERLSPAQDKKGKVAVRLHINSRGKIESAEIHSKSHIILGEQVELLIHKMQDEGFLWFPGQQNGKAVAATLEYMLNFGTTCHDPM